MLHHHNVGSSRQQCRSGVNFLTTPSLASLGIWGKHVSTPYFFLGQEAKQKRRCGGNIVLIDRPWDPHLCALKYLKKTLLFNLQASINIRNCYHATLLHNATMESSLHCALYAPYNPIKQEHPKVTLHSKATPTNNYVYTVSK